jgi:hypothetical protein
MDRCPADDPVGAAYTRHQLPDEAPDKRDLIGARTQLPWSGRADWVCSLPDHWERITEAVLSMMLTSRV